jgi:hypothetical protein
MLALIEPSTAPIEPTMATIKLMMRSRLDPIRPSGLRQRFASTIKPRAPNEPSVAPNELSVAPIEPMTAPVKPIMRSWF